MHFDNFDSIPGTCNYNFTSSSIDRDNAPFPVSTRMNKAVELHGDTTWTSVLREFTHFLSGVYGYDISKQVFLKEHSWGDEEETYYPVSSAE